MLGVGKDKENKAKDDKQEGEIKSVKHTQTKPDKEGETHHDLLPNVPEEVVTDAKTRVTEAEPGIPTEIQE